MRVYPNPDKLVDGEPVKVRDLERGGFLPAEGRHVPRNTYWLRRIGARDVIEGVPAMVTQGVDVQRDDVEVGPETAHPAAGSFDTPEAQAAADDGDSDDDKAAEMPQTTDHDGGTTDASDAAPTPAKKRGKSGGRSRKKSEG